MSTQKPGVSLYRPYIADTPIHLRSGDTPSDTATDTPSIKSLAIRYLANARAIHRAIQKPIHPPKKCIGADEGADTPLAAENSPKTFARAYTPDYWKRAYWVHDARAYWHSVCPRYWKGCATCSDSTLSKLDFCKRYPAPKVEVLQ